MRKLSFMWLLLCILLLVAPTMAQDAADIPTETIIASADALTVPETLPEGLVTVTFENNAEAPLIAMLARLNDGVTMDILMEAMVENPTGVLALVTLRGGPGVMPGESAAVTYTLEPGDYVLMNVGAQPPQMASLSVTDAAEVEITEPVADVSVVLIDFGFGIPLTIPSGERLWRIENAGQQWHEMVIAPVEPGTTIDDVRVLLADGEESSLQQFPLLMPLNNGQQVWLTVDLQPGSYALICHLPDILKGAEGHSHHELGMI